MCVSRESAGWLGSGGTELHSLGSRNNTTTTPRGACSAKANGIGLMFGLPAFHYVNCGPWSWMDGRTKVKASSAFLGSPTRHAGEPEETGLGWWSPNWVVCEWWQVSCSSPALTQETTDRPANREREGEAVCAKPNHKKTHSFISFHTSSLHAAAFLHSSLLLPLVILFPLYTVRTHTAKHVFFCASLFMLYVAKHTMDQMSNAGCCIVVLLCLFFRSSREGAQLWGDSVEPWSLSWFVLMAPHVEVSLGKTT